MEAPEMGLPSASLTTPWIASGCASSAGCQPQRRASIKAMLIGTVLIINRKFGLVNAELFWQQTSDLWGGNRFHNEYQKVRYIKI
jgi:hypothetical protein